MRKAFAIIVGALLLGAGVAGAKDQAGETIKLTVNGMVCSFCVQGIDKQFSKGGMVDDVYVNLDDRLVAIALKEGKTMSDEEARAFVKDAGYAVVKVERVPDTVASIRATSEAKKKS
ncbi:MAG: heavy-metal-associated domain-containing protein [Verrucomicrobiota bacterium]